MSPEGIWRWAQLKGITVIGTGDFTHPQWLGELKEKLSPSGNGLFRLRTDLQRGDVPDSCRSEVFFLLTAEISCIYRKNGRTRKIHSLLLAPDFAGASRINTALSRIGNLSADGRPILGLDAKDLLGIVLDSSPEAMLIPAHAWTPHFSVFGAESGFDSLDECFEDLSTFVHAIETGLSSDPPMNWRLSSLDNITLISNSDAHSPARIGREATVFATGLSYGSIVQGIRSRKGLVGTIEFFPEEGKYHYDGHRTCGVCLSPKETIRHNNLCPVCGKKVTVGVMHRVEELADRGDGFRPEGSPGFYSVISLPEILGEALKVGANSKAVHNEYQRLLSEFGNELTILLKVPPKEMKRAGSPLVGEAISRMRAGSVSIAPGFDGEYGKVRIFEGVAPKEIKGQTPLFT